MKFRSGVVIVAALALAVVAPAAHAAGGMNLSWDDCGVFGRAQKNFACATNGGSHFFIVSAMAPVPMPQLTGAVAVIDIQTNQPALSDWWRLDPAGCRRTSGTLSTSFLSGPFFCVDLWAGTAPGSFAYVAPAPVGSRQARLTLSAGIPGFTAADDLSEMYLFMFAIDHSRSTGTGACAGCTDGACLVLESVLLTQTAGLGDYTIHNPIVRQYIVWQAGGNAVPGGCPQATPTRNSTWGSIKSLYR